ncbi:MAG: CpsD/CapB family tyrosine-protein kinase [Lachnospiraceae bacterium]|jgi:capsular exopolysaccharide family|nr:CpsD/CapB family tyrosine-protein kinase [Lachnospiraceae bacterium]
MSEFDSGKQKLILKSNAKEDYNYREAIKTLRTNIQFCGSNIRVVMLTSSLPDEGKSSISISLAESLAQIGNKTILIDADIRKSVMFTRFQRAGHEEMYGLSQYLSGQKLLRDVIYETNVRDLSLIFAGPYSPNPTELLEENLFSIMFEVLRASYDYIIIDTPPMAEIIDGAIIAKHCDGAVMVIESGAISYHLEQKVKKQLETAGCRVLGAVLNKVDKEKFGKYGKYGYYGKYGKYGKYDRYDEEGRS